MKALIPLSRLCALAKVHVGRNLRPGESPLDLAADALVARGIVRPAGMSARRFLEANRDAVYGVAVPRTPKLDKPLPAVATDAFLQSYEWRRVRMQAIKKYGNRCQCCGASPATGAVINVDHIKPRKLFPDLGLSVENLQVLCADCNHGKGNWDMTDWRNQEQEG